MTRKRTNFTVAQKAEIFARDHGTCAFSGISVWLFDYGLRPNYEIDWADHISPSAKGGSSELSNGICASSFYNAKKKDNGSDNKFLFHYGRITPTYVAVHGKVPEHTIKDLQRRQNLRPIDWFVNRAVANTYFAFDWRCELEFNNKEYKRNDDYYFNVAFNMLSKKIKDKNYKLINERNLIDTNKPFGTNNLLKIENVTSIEEYTNWAEGLWPTYRFNWNIYNSFLSESCSTIKCELLNHLNSSPLGNAELANSLSHLVEDGYISELRQAS